MLAAGAERIDVVAVEAFQLLGDSLAKAVGLEEFAEGVGGGGKAARDTDARGGERGAHFAERGILAPDLRQVGKAQVL